MTIKHVTSGAHKINENKKNKKNYFKLPPIDVAKKEIGIRNSRINSMKDNKYKGIYAQDTDDIKPLSNKRFEEYDGKKNKNKSIEEVKTSNKDIKNHKKKLEKHQGNEEPLNKKYAKHETKGKEELKLEGLSIPKIPKSSLASGKDTEESKRKKSNKGISLSIFIEGNPSKKQVSLNKIKEESKKTNYASKQESRTGKELRKKMKDMQGENMKEDPVCNCDTEQIEPKGKLKCEY